MDRKTIVSLIDLTSLKDSETEAEIRSLCVRAQTPLGPVAAVCVWPHWVSLCAHQLAETPIAVATVVNFPHGRFSADAVLAETTQALTDGADEIDLVMPYAALKSGETEAAEDLVGAVAECCHAVDARLKVIIESGELRDPRLIRQASRLALRNGADFLKTSTGKVPVNATLPAADIMLQVIAEQGPTENGAPAGFKAAGGIGNLAQARAYLLLARNRMGTDFIQPAHFRFGASSLLDNVLNAAGD